MSGCLSSDFVDRRVDWVENLDHIKFLNELDSDYI